MEHMVRSYRVGMVRVEVGGLQEACLAHPQAIIQYLERQLPHQAHQRSCRTASDIKVSYQLLDTRN